MDQIVVQNRIENLAELEDGVRVIRLQHVHDLAQELGWPVREVELAALEAGVLPRRYLRSLGTVGLEGQAKLLRSAVAVVGLGGLGGSVVEGLARMGVGRLIVIDEDVFEDHNLNRQVLGTEANLGVSKVEAARRRVARINSAVEVVGHAVRLTQENAVVLLHGADVIVDGLDRLPARLVLQDAAQALGVPLVHGSIAGYLGQVMTIFPGEPGLRALYPSGRIPEQGVEVQLGCPAATPMMVAAWQVQEVLKVLLGCGELLRGRLLIMDAESGAVTVVELG